MQPKLQPMYFGGLFAEIPTQQDTDPQEQRINTANQDNGAVPKPASPATPANSKSRVAVQESWNDGRSAKASASGWNEEDNGYACEDDYEDDEDPEDPDNGTPAKRKAVPTMQRSVDGVVVPPSTPTKDLQPSTHVGERSGGKRRKQELHRRHSKRYRDNLGELFHELELILPEVVPECRFKTKSQIIATSVSAVKRLKTEVSKLEMRFVMSSNANRAKWVEDTVESAPVLQDAIEPFMRLILGLQRWKHSELWMRTTETSAGDGKQMSSGTEPTFRLRLERVTSATSPSDSPEASGFKEFVAGSEVMTFEAGDDSLVGRIATSLSPEWIDFQDKANLAGFRRGKLALRCGLVVCFAVPILVRGHVLAVVLFYDSQQRKDVAQGISIARDLASSIGNCYGAMKGKSILKDSEQRS